MFYIGFLGVAYITGNTYQSPGKDYTDREFIELIIL
jgi:hypothetical protein